MRIGAKTMGCLSGLLILVPAAMAAVNDAPLPPAAETSTGDQPYSAIWTRNVFDLTPKPPLVDPHKNEAPPPPNVKLIGIYTLFGKRAVLTLQEPGAKPGQPPSKEESYTMTEGERRGGLEVLEIDPKGRTVKVQNEGNISTIAIETNKPAGGAPPPGPIAGGAPHPFTAPTFTPTSVPVNPGQGGGVQLPPRQMRSTDYSQVNPSGGVSPTGYTPGTGASTGIGLGGLFGAPATQQSSPTPASTLTAEQQVALMMLQHTQFENSGTVAPPMPPIPGVTDNNSGSATDASAGSASQQQNSQVPAWVKARARGTFAAPPPTP